IALGGSLAPLPARAANVTTGGSGYVAGLTEAADAFERMGAVLFAAEAMANAARVARAAGSPRSAAALLTRTSILAKRCEGARTPGLVVADTSNCPAPRTR